MNDIDCPRARTEMTPCIARDGSTALADPPKPVCVGCGAEPRPLLRDLGERYAPARTATPGSAGQAADLLAEHVKAYVSGKG
jgi:hypothetical protein